MILFHGVVKYFTEMYRCQFPICMKTLDRTSMSLDASQKLFIARFVYSIYFFAVSINKINSHSWFSYSTHFFMALAAKGWTWLSSVYLSAMISKGFWAGVEGGWVGYKDQHVSSLCKNERKKNTRHKQTSLSIKQKRPLTQLACFLFVLNNAWLAYFS